MKVVWICHFSNSEMNEVLPLYKKGNEFAPWIPNMIKEFENRGDVELHIVAPYYFLKTSYSLKLRNVHYYFIPKGVPIYHRSYPDWFPLDMLFRYFLFNFRVGRIVNRIKPDVINLIGAENAHYASSIFKFKKNYPIIITIQGFISEQKINLKSRYNKFRAKTEIKIIKNYKHFIGELDSKKYINNFNNHFKFFKAYFPVNEQIINSLKDEQKIYDCIYFGRLDKTKGSEDFIKIIAELKNRKNNIRGVIIGIGDTSELQYLAEKLDCTNNIEIKEFAENQYELFRVVKQSKIVIVPTYFDRLPSTIREAMHLRVPVIAYNTGGIPYINNETENIILVERGNYLEIVNQTLELLEDQNYLEALSEKGYGFAQKEFSIKNNIQRMIDAYKSTILDYQL